MNTQKTVASSFVFDVMGAAPLGMPSGSVQVTPNLWMVAAPIDQWLDDSLYTANPHNRDWKDTYKKKSKDHLVGDKLTTEAQKAVDACLDDNGQLWKLDGHCRTGAWLAGKLAKPEYVVCRVYVLDKGLTIDSPETRLLLEHIENKKGKRTSTEDLQIAKKRTAHLFVPSTWFVEKQLSKAAFAECNKVLLDDTGAKFGADLVENMQKAVEARRLADSFKWKEPKAASNATDGEKERVKCLKLAFTATMGGAFLATYYTNKDACATFWQHWGEFDKMGDVQKKLFKLFTNSSGFNAAQKTKLAARVVTEFTVWSRMEWEPNKDQHIEEEAIRFEKWDQERKREQEAEAIKAQRKAEEEAEQAQFAAEFAEWEAKEAAKVASGESVDGNAKPFADDEKGLDEVPTEKGPSLEEQLTKVKAELKQAHFDKNNSGIDKDKKAAAEAAIIRLTSQRETLKKQLNIKD